MSDDKVKKKQPTPPVKEDTVQKEKEQKIENQNVGFNQDEEMPGIGYEIFGIPPIPNT